MLQSILFNLYEYLKKNTLWIILEIIQNLTNGLNSKCMLKTSHSFGPKHMCWATALYQSFAAEI